MLEAENDRLRARISNLEEALGACFLPPLEFGLTQQEARVFGVLLHRELATKEALMAALYRDEARDEPDPKILDVYIHKLRKKLQPYGIAIETVWGQGWRVSGEHRTKFWQRQGVAA